LPAGRGPPGARPKRAPVLSSSDVRTTARSTRRRLADSELASTRPMLPERDNLRARQRPPGPPWEPRGGGRQRRPRDIRERVLRGGPDRLWRECVRLRQEPPGSPELADAKRIQLYVARSPSTSRQFRPCVRAGARPANRRADTLRPLARAPGASSRFVTRRLVSLTRPDIAAIDFAVTLAEARDPPRCLRDQREGAQPGCVGGSARRAHLPDGALRTVHREASTCGARSSSGPDHAARGRPAADIDLAVDGPVDRRGQDIIRSDRGRHRDDRRRRTPPWNAIRPDKYLAYCTSLDHPKRPSWPWLVRRSRRARSGIRGPRGRPASDWSGSGASPT